MENTEERTFQILKYGKCERCDNIANEQHSCPYAEEIGNNYDLVCNCCDQCAAQCADDI